MCLTIQLYVQLVYTHMHNFVQIDAIINVASKIKLKMHPVMRLSVYLILLLLAMILVYKS